MPTAPKFCSRPDLLVHAQRECRGSTLLLMVLFTLWLAPAAWASDPESQSSGQLEKTLRNFQVQLLGVDIYWKDRLRLESKEKDVKIQIGGIVQLDSGYIGSDSELEGAFPGLRGYHTDFRRLRLCTFTSLYETVDIKFDIDFGGHQEIKDFWVGLRNLPVVGDVRAGHMKEPFSLEELTSNTNLTFMERSLPILALSPSRDVGALCQNTALGDRLTWSVGTFMVTGSFANLGDAAHQLSHFQGYAFAGRITGLPWYSDNGRRLMHTGLSYTYQDRDKTSKDAQLKVSALPESHLTEKRLVSTPSLTTGGMHMINPEWAVVLGPLSFQAEVVQAFVDANGAGDPCFWGGYLYASYFFTGEHRTYDRKKGVFSGVAPKDNFQLRGGGWGAWELALRFSCVDLNSGTIRGGRENDLTAGLNWYIDPNIRIMLNYIHADVRHRANPSVDNGTSDIFQGRFQISF